MKYIFYQKTKKIQLIRPIICLNRFEIFKLSKFWDLPVNIDLTNKLILFRRNRLRNQILPILRFFFNPKIEQAFSRFIQDLNLDQFYFNNQLRQHINFIQIYRIKFKKYKLKKINYFFSYLPISLQKRIFKQILKIYLKEITYKEIELILELNILKNK